MWLVSVERGLWDSTRWRFNKAVSLWTDKGSPTHYQYIQAPNMETRLTWVSNCITLQPFLPRALQSEYAIGKCHFLIWAESKKDHFKVTGTYLIKTQICLNAFELYILILSKAECEHLIISFRSESRCLAVSKNKLQLRAVLLFET